MSTTPVLIVLCFLTVGLLLLVEVHATGTWCVARSDASQLSLQKAIDYACGAGGADCSPILPTGLCYLPNTLQAHASYAFNSYYQRKSMSPGSCDFAATATVSASDPSYGSCVYPSSLSTAGGTASSTTSTQTPTVSGILPSPPAVFIPPSYGSSIPNSGEATSAEGRSFLLIIFLIIPGLSWKIV